MNARLDYWLIRTPITGQFGPFLLVNSGQIKHFSLVNSDLSHWSIRTFFPLVNSDLFPLVNSDLFSGQIGPFPQIKLNLTIVYGKIFPWNKIKNRHTLIISVLYRYQYSLKKIIFHIYIHSLKHIYHSEMNFCVHENDKTIF